MGVGPGDDAVSGNDVGLGGGRPAVDRHLATQVVYLVGGTERFERDQDAARAGQRHAQEVAAREACAEVRTMLSGLHREPLGGEGPLDDPGRPKLTLRWR